MKTTITFGPEGTRFGNRLTKRLFYFIFVVVAVSLPFFLFYFFFFSRFCFVLSSIAYIVTT